MFQLKNIYKTYQMGETKLNAINGVSLTVEAGEFIAIMGTSGSGKSTLMNILGLLDVPSSGSYKIFNQEVSKLNEDELAELRRNTIGFVFQQFYLLSKMNALENVALPCLYSKGKFDLNKAEKCLTQVQLESRFSHRPNQLSGGQQQRVAVARALINHPQVILADEPTGNLDSENANEILNLLVNLNKQGITLIIVTHEEDIARHANRIIRMKDGKILTDESKTSHAQTKASVDNNESDWTRHSLFLKIWVHVLQGLKILLANKLRTALSLLGVLIGVASVVAMLALGTGAQKAIEAQLASLGSNLLVLRPGVLNSGKVAKEVGSTSKFTLEDALSLKEAIPAIKDVASNVNGKVQAAYLNKNWATQVMGVSPSYVKMRASQPETGRFFTEEENQKRMRVALIGMTLVNELFGTQNPIGEMIKMNKINFQVIGVLPEKGASGFRDQDDVVVVPILTAMYRLLGKGNIDYIDIEIAEKTDLENAQTLILEHMTKRHHLAPGQEQSAFQIRNMADIQEALSESSKTMSILLAVIAAISLIVGGIGIMNILLVSVSERTKEIGLRKAIGARRSDILTQFIVEALVISIFGGVLGIVLGSIITFVLTMITGWATSISVFSIVLAFTFSVSIGIIFGIYPAKKASLLNPIEALRYE